MAFGDITVALRAIKFTFPRDSFGAENAGPRESHQPFPVGGSDCLMPDRHFK